MVRTPGTKLAHPDSRVYGRRSLASLARLAAVAVANHSKPCVVLDLFQMYSPSPSGRPAKEVRAFGGRDHVLEESITTDFALVHAARGDRFGNLVFHSSARNFNPLAAMAGRITIAQVEELAEALAPDEIHLPGVFVDRVVPVGRIEKRIEKRTVA